MNIIAYVLCEVRKKYHYVMFEKNLNKSDQYIKDDSKVEVWRAYTKKALDHQIIWASMIDKQSKLLGRD